MLFLQQAYLRKKGWRVISQASKVSSCRLLAWNVNADCEQCKDKTLDRSIDPKRRCQFGRHHGVSNVKVEKSLCLLWHWKPQMSLKVNLFPSTHLQWLITKCPPLKVKMIFWRAWVHVALMIITLLVLLLARALHLWVFCISGASRIGTVHQTIQITKQAFRGRSR